MKRPALAPLVRKWQRRLRLLDWDITAQYVDEPDEDEQWVGNCQCDRNRQRARIRIVEPGHEGWEPGEMGVDFGSVEAVLLHELLHVRLWDITQSSGDLLPHEERVIETLVPLLLHGHS